MDNLNLIMLLLFVLGVGLTLFIASLLAVPNYDLEWLRQEHGLINRLDDEMRKLSAQERARALTPEGMPDHAGSPHEITQSQPKRRRWG